MAKQTKKVSHCKAGSNNDTKKNKKPGQSFIVNDILI
jgi:hypothetical protein